MRDFVPMGLLSTAKFGLHVGYRVENARATLKTVVKAVAARQWSGRGIMQLGGCSVMTIAFRRGVVIAAFAMAFGNATVTDWSVFTDGDPKECWGVSAPKESVAEKDGQPVQVSRSDILLFVTYRIGGGAGEVSFTGGYPFAEGSTVSMAIADDKFDLFTDGEWAWPASPEADAALLAAMRNGTEAVLVARSARGNQTTDRFSLRGFTAASDEAQKQCQ
jgi:Invasion associated locus B (IalB) protein